MIVTSQVLSVLCWGSWFTWSVPAILAGAGGTQVEPVSAAAVGPVAIVGIGGMAATSAWWERADQTVWDSGSRALGEEAALYSLDRDPDTYGIRAPKSCRARQNTCSI